MKKNPETQNSQLKTQHSPSLPDTPVQVAAGLIVRAGRYLIARRRRDAHLGGLWEFPGGKREAGESLEDCLRRELREELGIEITEPVRFRVVSHRYPDKEVELHFFLCAVREGEARPLGCDDILWASPEEMPGYEFPPADRPLIEALRHRHRDEAGSDAVPR